MDCSLVQLRPEAGVDLMEFGRGCLVKLSLLVRGRASGEGDWVIDWSCEGKEERRGKSLTMI